MFDDRFCRQILFWVQTTILGNNAVSLAVTPSSHFKHLDTGEDGIGADSVTKLDLARISALRYRVLGKPSVKPPDKP